MLDATTSRHPGSVRARAQIKQVRAEHAFIDPATETVLVPEDKGFRWWTFYGGRANNLWAKTLSSKLGDKVTGSNFAIGFKDQAGQSEVAIRQAIAELRAEARPNHADALALAELCVRSRLSKFEPCLPDHRLNELFAGALTEWA